MPINTAAVGRRKKALPVQVEENLVNPILSIPQVREILSRFPSAEKYLLQPDLVMDFIDLYMRNELTDDLLSIDLESQNLPLKEIIRYFPSQRIFQKEEELELSLILEQEGAVSDDSHPCPKCGSIRSISSSAQTRRGDEGVSYFLTCARCQHKWSIK